MHIRMRRDSNNEKKKENPKLFCTLWSCNFSIFWILPIVWVILTSFRAGKGSYSGSFIPESFTITNFTRLFTETEVFNFPRWFGNTFFVAIFTCILSTFYLLSIAYVMSRLRFRARKPLLNISLILGMFPGFMSMIAIYYILKGVGLTDGSLKILALILVYSGGSGILQFYVAKGFFDMIPKAIDEAAMVDGATNWKIFTKIIMPLSKPIIIYTVITSFLAPWIDFILAKVIVGSDAKYYTVGNRTLEYVREGKYLPMVHSFCGRSSMCINSNCYFIYHNTKILCRGTCRLS